MTPRPGFLGKLLIVLAVIALLCLGSIAFAQPAPTSPPPPPINTGPGIPLQAESLRVETSADAKTETRPMGAPGAQRWSAGAQLLCTTQSGGWVTLFLPVAQPGRYRLDLYATRAPGLGIARISLDGQEIGDPFDGYAAEVTPTGRMQIGKVSLTAGDHALRFDITGKNGASRGFYLGLDRVDLIPIIEVGGITISYLSGLQTQANEVAGICQQVLVPRFAAYRKLTAAIYQGNSVVGRITDLLGCPDASDLAGAIMSRCATVSDLPLIMFGDLHLYRDSDLKASGGLAEDFVRITYRPRDDIFDWTFNYNTANGAPPTTLFFPVLVHDDGTFRTHGQPIAEAMTQHFDDFAPLFASGPHEAAEFALASRLRSFHPFARWFNEGVANWVQLQIISEFAPDFEAAFRSAMLPTPGVASLRPKINLLAWPQTDYESPIVLEGEEGVTSACYQFSTEAITRMLQDQPPGTLAKIVEKLKDRPAPDSDTICRAVQEVTGKDAKAILLDYIPERVRTGLEQDAPRRLSDQGREWLSQHDDRAALSFNQALEMTPSDPYLHLLFALATRRAGWAPFEAERHIAIAAALVQYDPDRAFTLPGEMDDEAWYVLGRLAQFRGQTEQAKAILQKLPPTHADAQAALKELAESENTESPSPP